MLKTFWSVGSIILLASSGCASLGPTTKRDIPQAPRIMSAEQKSQSSRSFNISWKNKVNPLWWFGNIDEPAPPKNYKPLNANRSFHYVLRNPFHNFHFYVIGIADKNFVRLGRCPASVFNPHDGWNWAVSQYKWLWLPFISYKRGNFKFYIGWREHGNFGIKLNF